MSKNAIGIAIIFFAVIGIQIAPDTVSSIQEHSAILIGLCLPIWHQLERVDIKGFFFKK